jgi:hypothetical protein
MSCRNLNILLFLLLRFVVEIAPNYRLVAKHEIQTRGVGALTRLRGGAFKENEEGLKHTVLNDDYEYRNDGHGAVIRVPKDFASFNRAVDNALARAKQSVSILKPLIYIDEGSYLIDRRYKEVAVSKDGWQYYKAHPPIYLDGRKSVPPCAPSFHTRANTPPDPSANSSIHQPSLDMSVTPTHQPTGQLRRCTDAGPSHCYSDSDAL